MQAAESTPKITPRTNLIGGGIHLACLALRRMLFSRQTMVSLLFFGFAVLAAIAWGIRERTALQFTQYVVVPIYLSFLLPLFCLCNTSPSIAGERDDQTLVYLLTTSLPRAWVHLAKYTAAMILSLVWTVGGFAILCVVAGPSGRETLKHFWPAACLATFAYSGMFHLFSVIFRRATIIAMAYALFLETLIGNMPGIAKRVTISFYTKCLMFDAGSAFGVETSGWTDPDLFLAVSPASAQLLLVALGTGFFAIGTWQFSRKEYS